MKPLFLGYADYVGFKERSIERFGPDIQVWYSERNGDGLGCVVHADTNPEDLPKTCMSYFISEWIDPDKEFGTGVVLNHKKIHRSK